MSYAHFFERVVGTTPWAWQASIGSEPACFDRVLRLPTGFGKTAGTVLPWLFHRVQRERADWPTRLVFCLPMRVLVEQTADSIRKWVATAGLQERVAVHQLMGGTEAGPWLDAPERPTVLVGTQDMLLSRALMRGYASPRARWPMEFALLNNDALWVLDEIQLMDVALATSTQLAAFRARVGTHRPVVHWWMSATLQPEWLQSIDFAERVPALRENLVRVPPNERAGGLFGISRRLELHAAAAPEELSRLALERHQPGTLTLVIVNTVERAVAVADALKPITPRRATRPTSSPGGPDIRLIHSQFRGNERAEWSRDFLGRDFCTAERLPPGGRVVVSTQVVEAGVDVSAALLITDLAPWPNLVQRFGRCARYAGERGTVVVSESLPSGRGEAGPYELESLRAALAACRRLGEDAGPAALERFEEELEAEVRASLFPYRPRHVLRRKDLDDLFDTTADLNGADLDVGRFIRSGEERDVSVFWRDVDPAERVVRDQDFPSREELCPAPLFGKRGVEAFVAEHAAWVYDYLDESWRRTTRRPPPGSVVMLSSRTGGYSSLGWDPRSPAPVNVVQPPTDRMIQRMERAISGQGDDALSEASAWQSIADHGRDVGALVRKLGEATGVDDVHLAHLSLAGRWHDAGKAHTVFQAALSADARALAPRPSAHDWAKAPPNAWRRNPYADRRGFRHELVSTLMLFELLHRADSGHQALIGGVRELLDSLGLAPVAAEEQLTGPLVDELRALDAESFNLVAYLVCAHHGKVRCQWAASPHDVEHEERLLGIDPGDVVPSVEIALPTGAAATPSLTVHLDSAAIGANPRYGASWTERVEGLLRRYGPFRLTFFEALIRCADWQASRALEVRQ